MSRTRIPISPIEREARQFERLSMSIAELDLPLRVVNRLNEKGILTVSDLLKCTQQQLLSISGFGLKTIEVIFAALEQLGFFREQVRLGRRS